MTDQLDAPVGTASDGESRAPDIDFNGVDRAQVRRMLALSPSERLAWLQDIVEDIVELRRLNEKHAIR